jgi:hypothetical protein
LCREDSFFYDEEKVLFLRQPFFPYLDSRGLLCVREDGHLAGYASGMAGVFLVVSSPAFGRGLAARGVEALNILPLNRFSLNFPDRELLAGHCERGAALSFLCAGGLTTGNYIASPAFFAPRSFGLHAGFSAPFILKAKCADEFSGGPAEAKRPAPCGEFPVRKARLPLILCRGAGTRGRPERVWGIREDS